jgi:hypothetical protein
LITHLQRCRAYGAASVLNLVSFSELMAAVQKKAGAPG